MDRTKWNHIVSTEKVQLRIKENRTILNTIWKRKENDKTYKKSNINDCSCGNSGGERKEDINNKGTEE